MGLKSFKEFVQSIKEMAVALGSNTKWVDDTFSKNARRNRYHNTMNHPEMKYKGLPDHIKVHSKKLDGYTLISTNDHNKHETLHQSTIEHHDHLHGIPLRHDVQDVVHRVHDDSLPRNHSQHIMMNHINRSGRPLVSASEQFEPGHKMWRSLVKNALASGHHVYHYDGDKIHKTTHENIENHLDNSYGKTGDFKSKHMIISKKPLSEKVYND